MAHDSRASLHAAAAPSPSSMAPDYDHRSDDSSSQECRRIEPTRQSFPYTLSRANAVQASPEPRRPGWSVLQAMQTAGLLVVVAAIGGAVVLRPVLNETAWGGVSAAESPPQSTAVSLPFFTPSLHAGAMHTPPVISTIKSRLSL